MPGEKKYEALESWDESDRTITQMGYFSWRPRFLEVFNTPAIFTLVFAVSNLAMIMSYSILSLIIPTLESVFNLNSKQTGFILMANDISGMIAAIFMANYCSARKTKWIAVGMLIVALSAVIPASTTLFAEYPTPRIGNTSSLSSTYEIEQDKQYGICNETIVNAEEKREAGEYAVRNHNYYWMFILGSLLQGIGATPPGIAGSTYMDEIFPQKMFGIAISFLYVVAFLGFPISMMLGAVYLQYYVTLNPPPGLTIQDKEWVGAWWMGMFYPSIAVLFLSFFVGLYPRQMPAAKKVLADKIKKGITSANEKRQELGRSLTEITRDMIPAYFRMLKNKALTALIVGDMFLFLQIGSYSFYPKIYSMVFRLNPREVGSILGLANLIGFGVGLVAGGVLTKAKNWKPRTLQLIYCILTTVALPFTFGLFLYCPTDTYAGVDVHYFNTASNSTQLGVPSLLAECNSDCACTTAFYQPVCDNGITYFSPCHAGCSDVDLDDPTAVNGTVSQYLECKCTESGTVRPGECGGKCTSRMIWSIIISQINTGIRFAGFPAHAIVYQRVVAESDRTIAQGLRSSATKALGTMPSPLMYGAVLDSLCTVWRKTEDGDVGNCWLYDVPKVVAAFVFIRFGLTSVSAICSWLAWFWMKSPPKNAVTDEIENVQLDEEKEDEIAFSDEDQKEEGKMLG